MSVYLSSLLGTSDEGEAVWRPHSEGKNRLAWTMQWRRRWVASRGNKINNRKTLQLRQGNKSHKTKRCWLHCHSCTFYNPGKVPVPKCHDVNMDDGKMRPDQKRQKCKNNISSLPCVLLINAELMDTAVRHTCNSMQWISFPARKFCVSMTRMTSTISHLIKLFFYGDIIGNSAFVYDDNFFLFTSNTGIQLA